MCEIQRIWAEGMGNASLCRDLDRDRDQDWDLKTGFYITVCTVHTTQVQGTIVFCCARPDPWHGPSVQCVLAIRPKIYAWLVTQINGNQKLFFISSFT